MRKFVNLSNVKSLYFQIRKSGLPKKVSLRKAVELEKEVSK